MVKVEKEAKRNEEERRERQEKERREREARALKVSNLNKALLTPEQNVGPTSPAAWTSWHHVM
jgi:hypothetical protein